MVINNIKTISVASQKGGCGKTTCVQVGANILSAPPFGFRILVMDLDSQMSTYITRQNDLAHSSEIPAYDILTMDVDGYLELMTKHADSKLNFQAGVDQKGRIVYNTGIDRTIDLPNGKIKKAENQLLYNFDITKTLKENYDLILIDLPGSLTTIDDVGEAIYQSDALIIPYKPSVKDYLSLSTFLDVVDSIRTIREDDGHKQIIFSYINEYSNTSNYTEMKKMDKDFDKYKVVRSKINLRNRKTYLNMDTMSKSIFQKAQIEKNTNVNENIEIKKFTYELIEVLEKISEFKNIKSLTV